jgi:hypothetical protein
MWLPRYWGVWFRTLIIWIWSWLSSVSHIPRWMFPDIAHENFTSLFACIAKLQLVALDGSSAAWLALSEFVLLLFLPKSAFRRVHYWSLESILDGDGWSNHNVMMSGTEGIAHSARQWANNLVGRMVSSHQWLHSRWGALLADAIYEELRPFIGNERLGGRSRC